MQKATALVTGGAGFIGSHVVNHLISMEYRVIVLDDLSGGFIENIHPSAEFCKGSITDVFLVNGLFEAYQFDFVYHLAAYAAEGLSHFIRKFNYENNLIGSINLINASVNFGVKCFVFASSIAVYGNNALPYSELQNPQPEDPYGIAKYAVEMDLRNAHQLFGLNYIIFRPHNVYGIGQNIADPYRNVVGIFMNQVLKGEPLTLFGNGEQTRAFSHVADVAATMAQSVTVLPAYNQIFNLGADTFYTINQLANFVETAMGRAVGRKYLKARLEVEHAYADHSKIQAVFGKKAALAFELGLAQMADWVKNTGPRQSKPFNGIEITKNLPDSWKNSL